MWLDENGGKVRWQFVETLLPKVAAKMIILLFDKRYRDDNRDDLVLYIEKKQESHFVLLNFVNKIPDIDNVRIYLFGASELFFY